MRKTYGEMTAEALREIGVLVLVFAVLDRLVTGAITIEWTLAAVCVCAFSFFSGYLLERWRLDA